MSGYDTDFVRWSEHQSDLLRRIAAGEHVNEQVDWENILEEIVALARIDRRDLASRIQTILVHLMRLQASPAENLRHGWRQTIVIQRDGIETLLDDSPSLRPTLEAVIAKQMPTARRLVAMTIDEYDETPRVPLDQLSYSEEQVLGPWLPAVVA